MHQSFMCRRCSIIFWLPTLNLYVRDFTAAPHFIMFEWTARERQQLSAVPSFGSVIDGFCLARRLCHNWTVNVMTPLFHE